MTLLHPTDAARSFPGFAPLGEAKSGQALRQRTARPLSEERLTDMSKRTDKLGFVAPQATEFGVRAEVWRKAVAATDAMKAPADRSAEAQDQYEDELAAAVDAEDDAAEAIIGAPVETTAQIALKVDVMFRRWMGGGSFADPKVRKQVANLAPAGFRQKDDRDMAQCLLALYLDLTGDPIPSPRATTQPEPSVFGAAHDRFMAAADANAEWQDANPCCPDETPAESTALAAKAEALHSAMREAQRVMMATAAHTPADLAKKIAASFYMVDGLDYDPTREDHGLIASNGSEGDLALLACYRDALAMDPATITLPTIAAGQTEWDAAWSAFEIARGKRDALYEARDPEQDLSDEWADAARATVAAAVDLLNTRTPDARALVAKSRALLDVAFTADRIGDDADSPVTLSRLLAEHDSFGPGIAVSSYLDALWLSGERSGLVTLTAQVFHPHPWLEELRTKFAGRIVDRPEHEWAPPRYVVETDDPDAYPGAAAMWNALPEHERQLVEDYVACRGHRV